MSDILSIGHLPIRDTSIARKQYHGYSPYTSSYANGDEIRIAIQSQDLYLLPSESYLTIEVSAERKTGANFANVAATWAACYAQHLFSEIRYEINNIEIDRIKTPGIVSAVKKMAALRPCEVKLHNLESHYCQKELAARKYVFIVPLNQLFGFCEDYRKIIMNAKHELILVRNRKDIYSYVSASESFNIQVKRIQWEVPHIQLSDYAKLSMLRYLEKKRTITVPYRSWDLYEMPQLPRTSRHIWTVKSTSQATKPRYVLVVFQTNKLIVSENASTFSSCNITNVKLFLNSEYYPYENLNCVFDTAASNCQEQYLQLLNIQKSYYSGQEGPNPLPYGLSEFEQNPIFAFDCSRTDESLLNGAVDIRLEINASENIPDKTAAYCLLIYDNQFEYSPFSSIVVKST